MRIVSSTIGVAIALLAPATAAVERPNVVLMMADDLGLGDLGHLGNPFVRTPNLDRLSRAGLRFDRFYAASPVCSPTRCSVLTGRHGYRSGNWRSRWGRLPPEETTIAEVLREHGWTTGHFGKWHLGFTERTEPADPNDHAEDLDADGEAPLDGADRGALELDRHGFDVQFSTFHQVPTWDPLVRTLGQQGGRNWWYPVAVGEPSHRVESPYRGDRGERVTENVDGDDSRILMDRVVPFVEDAVRRETPFLAVIWFHAPHYPVVAGPHTTALYADRSGFDQNYFGCITAMDEQIGRFRDALDGLGCLDDTMWWFCSDNGAARPESAAPFRKGKETLREGGLRVPSFLVWPARVTPGRSTFVPVTTSDYFPTILDLLDVRLADPVAPLDGISVRDVVEGTRIQGRPRTLGFESHGMIGAVRDRWKLLFPGEQRLELYDLEADPDELHDVAAFHPDVLVELARWLDEWRRSVHASAQGADWGTPTRVAKWWGVDLDVSLEQLARRQSGSR
ncbi:MAG: sulfatase-like hydrolase/transferase [bacterium]